MMSFRQWLGAIWSGVTTTWTGMTITIPYLFRKPFTVQYPEETVVIPATERGLHNFKIDLCINCLQCAKICPVDCITIEGESKGKTARIHRFEIDYTKCLFCALCTEPCPTECILMGPTFDLVGYTREEVIIDYADRDNPRVWNGEEQPSYEIAKFARK